MATLTLVPAKPEERQDEAAEMRAAILAVERLTTHALSPHVLAAVEAFVALLELFEPKASGGA